MFRRFFLSFLFCLISSTVFAVDEPSNLGRAADPPAGASMTMTPTGGGVLLSVKGMEVYENLVYLYGGDGVETTTLSSTGTAKLSSCCWINLCFKGSDGLWHYLLVSDQNQVVPKEWMGSGVCVMPDFGKGSAVVYCGWLRQEYRGGK